MGFGMVEAEGIALESLIGEGTLLSLGNSWMGCSALGTRLSHRVSSLKRTDRMAFLSLTSSWSVAYLVDSRFAFCARQARQSTVDLRLASRRAIAYSNRSPGGETTCKRSTTKVIEGLPARWILCRLSIERSPQHRYLVHRTVDWLHQSRDDICDRREKSWRRSSSSSSLLFTDPLFRFVQASLNPCSLSSFQSVICD